MTAFSMPVGINLIYHSVGPGGGMERYVRDLVRAIPARGIQLRVITRNLNWSSDVPRDVSFVVMPFPKWMGRFAGIVFERTAKNRLNPGWQTIAISRVPSMVDLSISGGTHIGHLTEKGKGQMSLYDRITIRHERSMYASSKAVVAHSCRTANELCLLYGLDEAKVHAIYPPIDAGQFCLQARANRVSLRKKLGIADDEMLLVFPSNDHIRKGADLILGALAKTNARIRLAVASRTPLVSHDHRVLNLGYQSDMPSLYGAADAAILASKYEPFGLVGPEAVLCGTPVLLSKQVGATEVLSDKACLQFEQSIDSLCMVLNEAVQRFRAGTLTIENPAEHIHYPYALDRHVDALLRLLQQRPD